MASTAEMMCSDLHFKIKFNNDNYNDQPLKVFDRKDLSYKEFCSIVENVYGLSQGSISGITYIDEDLDEVAVGSNEEFNQLLKSAHKWRQNNQFCLLNITTQVDLSEEFENIEPASSATGSDITDMGSVQLEVLNKVNDMNKKLEPLLNAQSEPEPPLWFKQYMKQFKGEILHEVAGLIQNQTPHEKATKICKSKHLSEHALDKSDIHKKIEKFSSKERKLQQKMSRKHDLAKLIKLNTKLRHVNAEKNMLIDSLSEEEKRFWKASVQQGSSGKLLTRMDAKEVVNSNQHCITVKPGDTFEYTWSVVNCGQQAWNEDTHLNLMSCSQGFNPPVPRVRCPRLESGEMGQISLELQAPRTPGTYSSIWRLMHVGTPFGQCLTCMVLVDTKDQSTLKAKSQEDISSEDDESSCDDHSEDFVVVPSSFQDKMHARHSTCSDGSIEILNHTPTGERTPLDTTPHKSWEFSQNGPGVYRNQQGDMIQPPKLTLDKESIYPNLTLEKENLTRETETMCTNTTPGKESMCTNTTQGKESMLPNTTQGKDSMLPNTTQGKDSIYPSQGQAPVALTLEEDSILIVDEQGQCNIAEKNKPSSCSNPNDNSWSTVDVLPLKANLNQTWPMAEMIAREASKAAGKAAKDAMNASFAASTAASMVVNEFMNHPGQNVPSTRTTFNMHTSSDGTHAHSTNNASQSHTTNGTHAYSTNSGTHSHATPNASHSHATSTSSTHTQSTTRSTTNNSSNTEAPPPGINVNDIINICTAQAATTAQNIISGLLANNQNGLGNLTSQVMGGFMNMSGAGAGHSESEVITHVQTNVPVSPPQSMTAVAHLLENLLANVSRSTNETSNEQATTPQPHQVYTRVPQARSSDQTPANIFLNYPQARTLTANKSSEAPCTRKSDSWKQKASKNHLARDQGKSRGMDLSSMLSVPISSDNSDSGHLSNNSKSKKKAVRKSIKLDRNHARNKIHHRKKDQSDSSRLDPSIWMNLTKRVQDLNTGSGSQTVPVSPNIWSLRPDAPPPTPARPISAETFVNPVSFLNFPAVPSTSPSNNDASGTPAGGNSTSGNSASGSSASGNSASGSFASGNSASGNSARNTFVKNSTSTSSVRNPRGSPAVSTQASVPNMSEKMNQLLEMGYMDKKMNKTILEECGFNVDTALHKLAAVYNPMPVAPSPVARSQKTPSAGAQPSRVKKSKFELEIDDMMSHLMDMGFDSMTENMRALTEANFKLDEAVFALVAAREQAAENQEAAAADARPNCTGH